jgi:hypothetical protein
MCVAEGRDIGCTVPGIRHMMPRSTTSPMEDVSCEHKNSSEKPHGTVKDLILKFSKHKFTGFDAADRRNSSSTSSRNSNSSNGKVREGSCSSTSTSSSSPEPWLSKCHPTHPSACSLSTSFRKKESGENPHGLKGNNVVHKEADHDDDYDDEVSIGSMADFMIRRQHTTPEVAEGIDGSVGERGSSVTFSESVSSFGIERIPECDHSKLFYSQEEIAQFQYEAFMESCGLDPKYVPP